METLLIDTHSGEVVDKLYHLISGLWILVHLGGYGVVLFTKTTEREGGEREAGHVYAFYMIVVIQHSTYSLLNSLFLSIRNETSLSASSVALW